MPEGHTIHRLARDLAHDLRGAAVGASSPQGRFVESAAQLDGATLLRAEAFGKQLFLDWSTGETLSIHLGLIGKFRRGPAERTPSEATRLRLTSPDATTAWDLTGPMVCALVDPIERGRIAAAIGPDPLRRNASPAEFTRRAQRKRSPIGAVLLDQSVIAGIGNVYRAEVCFLCGIDPRRGVTELTDDDLGALWHTSVVQLRNGVRLNRIVTRVPDELGRSMLAKIPPGERLYAYKRRGEPCHRCTTPIAMVELGARSTWFCPRCQS